MADQEIRVNLVVEVNKALQEGKRFEEAVVKWKEKLIELQNAGMSVKSAFQGLSKQFSESFVGQKKELEFQLRAMKTAAEEIQKVQARSAQATISPLESGRSFAAMVDEWKRKIYELRAAGLTTKAAFEGLKVELRQTFVGSKEQFAAASKALETAKNEVTGLETKAGNLSFSWQRLLRTFQGTLSALVIFRVINGVINSLEELIKKSKETIEVLAQFQISTNALRKMGLDVSIKKNIDFIRELRKEYSMFTELELADTIAKIQLMTREFGFTEDEIRKIAKATIDASIVMGGSIDDVKDAIVRFIATGYGESLQKIMPVNRVQVALKAEEMGYGRNYLALTELQRARVAYNLILEYSANLHELAAEKAGTEAGEIQALEAQIRSVDEVSGYLSLGLLKIVKEFDLLASKLKFTVIVDLNLLAKFFEFIITYLKIVNLQAKESFNIITEKERAELEKLKQALVEIYEMRRKLEKLRQKTIIEGDWENVSILYEDMFKEGPLGPPRIIDDKEEQGAQDDSLRRWRDFYSSLLELESDFTNDMTKAWSDYVNDLEEIDREHIERSMELWEDYQEKLEDINEDLAWDIYNAQIDLQHNLEDLEIDTQRRLEDAARKYHENELKAEREFQERMRKLREEFLFDLEDALRERDALQVLRLIRKYQLDKQQAEREYELERQERLEAYKQEIEDIKRQAERKREELYREFQRKLEDLNRQAERERQQALENYNKAVAEENERWQKAQADRNEKYKQQVEDIKNNLLNKLQAEALAFFTDAETATDEFAKKVSTAIDTVFGENGLIKANFDNFKSYINSAVSEAQKAYNTIQNLVKNAQSLLNSISSTTPTYVNGGLVVNPNAIPYFAGGYQSGGVVFANRPTMALFGEGGPEIASFIPLNKLNSLGGGGQARIEVWLSPGLEGKIVDNALNRTAQIFLDVLEAR